MGALGVPRAWWLCCHSRAACHWLIFGMLSTEQELKLSLRYPVWMLLLCRKHQSALRREIRSVSLLSTAAQRCTWRLCSSGGDLLQASIAVACVLCPHMAYIANTLSSMVAKWSFFEYIISVKKWITGIVQVKAPATNQNNNSGDPSTVFLLRGKWWYGQQQQYLDREIGNYGPNV